MGAERTPCATHNRGGATGGRRKLEHCKVPKAARREPLMAMTVPSRVLRMSLGARSCSRRRPRRRRWISVDDVEARGTTRPRALGSSCNGGSVLFQAFPSAHERMRKSRTGYTCARLLNLRNRASYIT